MIFDIFIKTYNKHFTKLYYCLRSINLYAYGFRQIILITDSTDINDYSNYINEFTRIPIILIKLDTPKIDVQLLSGIGYNWQQVIKLEWYKYTDADAILTIDSDMIMIKFFSPFSYFKDDKPIWFYREWSETNGNYKWKSCVDKLFEQLPTFDGMPIHCFMLLKEDTINFGKYLLDKTKNDILSFFIENGINNTCSEYELYFNYLYNFSKHYCLINDKDYFYNYWWNRHFLQLPYDANKLGFLDENDPLFITEMTYMIDGNYTPQDFEKRIIKGERINYTIFRINNNFKNICDEIILKDLHKYIIDYTNTDNNKLIQLANHVQFMTFNKYDFAYKLEHDEIVLLIVFNNKINTKLVDKSYLTDNSLKKFPLHLLSIK